MTFAQWLEKDGRTQSEIARVLGTTRQAVQSWVAGRVRPTLYYALAVEALTGGAVTPQSWLEQSERLAIQGLAALASASRD
jgi:transcriptional regulator with XRE-family HTH domain